MLGGECPGKVDRGPKALADRCARANLSPYPLPRYGIFSDLDGSLSGYAGGKEAEKFKMLHDIISKSSRRPRVGAFRTPE